MVTLILFILAGILKAVKDSLLPERRPYSRFKYLRGVFWVKGTGHKTWFGYYWDAWHIADTLRIICFCLAAVFYNPIWESPSIANIISILILFTATTMVFNLCYDWLFKIQK